MSVAQEAPAVQVVDSIQLEESGSVINVHPVVQVDPDGGFLVADVSEAQVRRYSEHGELLWHLGRRGRGPNEFQSTRAAARLPDGRVLVADLPDRLVLINAAGTETIKSLGIHLSRPEDLEVSDDSTVIVGGILGSPFGPGQTPASYLAGPRLHLIDVDDEVVTRSFFRPFEGYNIDIAAMAGSVVFSEWGGLIAAAALPKDTVYFFAKSGVALGQVPLPSAHFRVIEPLNPDDFQDPRKRQAWLESFDSVTGIEWLNADTLVVEYRSLVGTEMRWSLVVMTRAGERVLEWRNSPRLFTVTEAGLLVLQAPNSLTPDKWIVVRLPS